MTPKFSPEQAVEIKTALENHGVEYLFIGKSGAILLGYPDTTQDVDIFAPKDPVNGRKLVNALKEIGFIFEGEAETATISGKDFIQLKNGPFDLDIVHAPDGIESFHEAKKRLQPRRVFRSRQLMTSLKAKRPQVEQRTRGIYRCLPASGTSICSVIPSP